MAKITKKTKVVEKIVQVKEEIFNLELTKAEAKLIYCLVGTTENSNYTGIEEIKSLFDAFTNLGLEYKYSLFKQVNRFTNNKEAKEYLEKS